MASLADTMANTLEAPIEPASFGLQQDAKNSGDLLGREVQRLFPPSGSLQQQEKEGRVYVTGTGKRQVVLIEGPGKHRVVDVGIGAPNGIALSPDGGTLAVSDFTGAAAVAFRVEADGSLSSRMPVFPYRDFGPTVESRGDGMACDARNRWYVSTVAGIQVYDPNGRPVGLVPAPSPAAVTSCALAGDRLYALSQGKIWRRPVNLSSSR